MDFTMVVKYCCCHECRLFLLLLCSVFGIVGANGQINTPDPQEFMQVQSRATSGDVRAEHDLADLYKQGRGVKQDYSEAVKWYIKAAEKGDADSQLNLGYAYEMGLGTRKNEKEAVRWLEKAAQQGIADAQLSVGGAYLYGKGVRKDPIAAAHWYQRAAEQGNGDAMLALGSIYWLGQGVSRDLVTAYMWLLLSERFGSIQMRLKENPLVVDVPSTRHDLLRLMNESEVSEARSLADKWVADHNKLLPINPKQ